MYLVSCHWLYIFSVAGLCEKRKPIFTVSVLYTLIVKGVTTHAIEVVVFIPAVAGPIPEVTFRVLCRTAHGFSDQELKLL